MEKYLNLFHFCLYRALCRINKATDRIDPFRQISKMPFFKRRLDERGIDYQKEMDRAYNDKNFGICVTYAGSLLGIILAIFFLSIENIFTGLLGVKKVSLIVHLAPPLILAGAIDYFYVDREDK